LALAVILLPAPGLVQAQTVTWNGSGPMGFERDKLYVVSDAYYPNRRVWRIDNPFSSADKTELYRQDTGWGSEGGGNYIAFTTIALGPFPPAVPGTPINPSAPLQMYHWGWASFNPSGTIQGSIVYAGNPATVALSIPNAWTIRTATDIYKHAWSGGEVNQLTGEVYFSGCEDTRIGRVATPASMMILNPVTGIYRRCPYFTPESSADSALVNNDYVMSDMAIDAKGDAYIVTAKNAYATSFHLVKITPGSDGEPWPYTVVQQFSGASMTVDMFGMAFLNGYLFLANANLYKIDVFSGFVTNIGALGVGGSAFDLASAQTAPIIDGYVYNDLNGDGDITGDPGAPNVTVEIYDSNKQYLGSRQTTANGYYNFMVKLDEVNPENTTYYIRLKQPRIKIGNRYIPATQTYASAGVFTGYATTAYTSTYDNEAGTWTNDVPMVSGGPCLGAHVFGIDGASTTWNSSNHAMFYSVVNIQGSNHVASADFAITAISDYGDAPFTSISNSFKSKVSDGGPAMNVFGKYLFMGAGVSGETPAADITTPVAEADTDNYDDGVFIVADEGDFTIQNRYFEVNKTTATPVVQNIKVAVNGKFRGRGYLNAWITRTAAGASPTITKIASNLQDTDNDGFITFSYTPGLNIPNGETTAYMRFFFSTMKFTGNSDYDSIPVNRAATDEWINYGEVEDYKIIFRGLHEPSGVTWPASSSITYGQSLAGAVIGGNAAPYGTFSWVNPTLRPKNSGNQKLCWSPLPAYAGEFIEMERDVAVTVNPKALSIISVDVSDKYDDASSIAFVKDVHFSGYEFDDATTPLLIRTDFTATGTFANLALLNTPQTVSVTLANLNTAYSSHYAIPAENSGQASILNELPQKGVIICSRHPNGKELEFSVLAINSTTRGLRLPQLTKNSRDVLSSAFGSESANARGLLIYDKDDGLVEFWNGSAWRRIVEDEVTGGAVSAPPAEHNGLLIGSVENPEKFAALQLESNSQGLRLPQISQEAIDRLFPLLTTCSSVSKGLLVFNITTNHLCCWNGSAWRTLSESDAAPAFSPSGTAPSSKGLVIGCVSIPRFYSVLELCSSLQGLRLPQVSASARNGLTVGADPAKASGIMLFNSDSNEINFYNGTSWKKLLFD
jgi:hypothetical protein